MAPKEKVVTGNPLGTFGDDFDRDCTIQYCNNGLVTWVISRIQLSYFLLLS